MLRARRRVALLLGIVGCGGLLGVQARVNGELGARVHSALAAATVSFAGGTLLLILVVAALPKARAGTIALIRATTKWWWWLGGLAGAMVVASTAQGVPQLGVALVSVCVVAGTASGALVVDELGLGPGGAQPVTRVRLAGAALAVAAVTIGTVGEHHASVRPALLALLFVAGAASAVQQAANGRIRVTADDARVAALVSFAVGSLALLVVTGAAGQLGGRDWPSTWWLYTGGAAGAVYIGVAAAVVRRLGVLTVSLATVAGQLIAAVALDAVWPEPGASLRLPTVISAALTLVAVMIAR